MQNGDKPNIILAGRGIQVKMLKTLDRMVYLYQIVHTNTF